MKFLKKIMQVALVIFFFASLAKTTVFADTVGGRFVDKDNRKYYIKDDNKAIYWHKIDGKTYYFGARGEMVVGWQRLEISGTGYRDDLFSNNPILEIGLQREWYYFGEDGALQEFVGWKALDVKTKESIGRVYGEKREGLEDREEKRYYTYYYFNPNHTLKTGWLYDQSRWYYLSQTGTNERNYLGGERYAGWLKDGSTWYYLNPSDGVMQTGWQKVNGRWYYLRSSGAMATDWLKDGSTWYYLDATNGDMKTGWVYVGNTWYYLRSSGAMETGWLYLGNTWYYLRSSGAMEKGWVYLGNTWYYLENSGAMKTGWFQVNGKWYYAYGSGALAVSTTVDGYRFNSNGEWVR